MTPSPAEPSRTPAHAVTAPPRREAPSTGRAAGKHVSVLSVAGLLLAAALGCLLLHLAMPFDGARVPPGQRGFVGEGLQVSPVTATSPLQHGDTVVAVDGRPLADQVRSLASPRGLVEAGRRGAAWRVGDTLSYTVVRDGRRVEVPVVLERYPLGTVASQNWGTIVFALVYLLVAGFVYARRPSEPATRVLFLSGAALLGATTWSLGLTVACVLTGWGLLLFAITTVLSFLLFWMTCLHFALIFPRPLAIARRRWLWPLLYGGPALTLLVTWGSSRASSASMLDWLGGLAPRTDTYASLLLFGALAAAVWQYRTQASAPARQQVRWVLFGALLAGTPGLVLYLVPPLLDVPRLHANAIGAFAAIFPIAVAIAVLRHNLFDIDRLLSHTLVYGALTAGIVGLYVAIVSAFGSVVGARSGLLVTLLATSAVAAAFHPLRARLQRLVDRFVYGERDEPVQMLDRLGRRLEATADPERVLPTLVETVAQALKLPYVALTLREGGGSRIVADYGRPDAPALELPLLDERTVAGHLLVAPRDRGSGLTEADRTLLEAVARQAGGVVQRVRLTRALRRSRQQLVTLREEERRRLRRDLHDGLGPALASMALKLEAARNLLHSARPGADALLVELGEQVHDAVAEIRRLVYALRPPALDELGLVGALREQARQYEQEGVRIVVEAPDRLPPLPAAVEVAAFRIVQEGMTNVVRHAHASRCVVSLSVEGPFVVRIEDDGVGLGEHRRAGVGLASMRERVAELGGTWTVESGTSGDAARSGTRLTARLPLGEEEP